MVFGNFTASISDSAGFCAESVLQTPFSTSSGGKLVRLAGLEPARLSPLPPQSSVSANSTISATYGPEENVPKNLPKRKCGMSIDKSKPVTLLNSAIKRNTSLTALEQARNSLPRHHFISFPAINFGVALH
jgi:hypothetical protein